MGAGATGRLGSNKSRQRMSGSNINLKFEHQSMPLIVARRWAGEAATITLTICSQRATVV